MALIYNFHIFFILRIKLNLIFFQFQNATIYKNLCFNLLKLTMLKIFILRFQLCFNRLIENLFLLHLIFKNLDFWFSLWILILILILCRLNDSDFINKLMIIIFVVKHRYNFSILLFCLLNYAHWNFSLFYIL